MKNRLLVITLLLWSSVLQASDNRLKDAAMEGNLQKVNSLIQSGLSPVQNKDALHAAAFSGNIEIVKLLIDNKADVNAKNESALLLYMFQLIRAIMKLQII